VSGSEPLHVRFIGAISELGVKTVNGGKAFTHRETGKTDMRECRIIFQQMIWFKMYKIARMLLPRQWVRHPYPEQRLRV